MRDGGTQRKRGGGVEGEVFEGGAIGGGGRSRRGREGGGSNPQAAKFGVASLTKV